jgi:hypothetical protein
MKSEPPSFKEPRYDKLIAAYWQQEFIKHLTEVHDFYKVDTPPLTWWQAKVRLWKWRLNLVARFRAWLHRDCDSDY